MTNPYFRALTDNLKYLLVISWQKMVARGGRSRPSMAYATFGLPAHQIEPPTREFSKAIANF